jgi:hypothetical protein
LRNFRKGFYEQRKILAGLKRANREQELVSNA